MFTITFGQSEKTAQGGCELLLLFFLENVQSPLLLHAYEHRLSLSLNSTIMNILMPVLQLLTKCPLSIVLCYSGCYKFWTKVLHYLVTVSPIMFIWALGFMEPFSSICIYQLQCYLPMQAIIQYVLTTLIHMNLFPWQANTFQIPLILSGLILFVLCEMILTCISSRSIYSIKIRFIWISSFSDLLYCLAIPFILAILASILIFTFIRLAICQPFDPYSIFSLTYF